MIPTPSTPILTSADILARARKIAWTLQVGGHRINPDALSAIMAGRHGEEGEAFGNTILVAAGPAANEAEIDFEIKRALTR